jgi:hypothetical protein
MDTKKSLKRRAALLAIPLSISSLLYFLATSARVPIRVTLKVPNLEIVVEVNPNKFRSDFLEYEIGTLIAASGAIPSPK